MSDGSRWEVKINNWDLGSTGNATAWSYAHEHIADVAMFYGKFHYEIIGDRECDAVIDFITELVHYISKLQGELIEANSIIKKERENEPQRTKNQATEREAGHTRQTD